jgi:tRNA A-37 threonylcarbamoyl transferase component Bud32
LVPPPIEPPPAAPSGAPLDLLEAQELSRTRTFAALAVVLPLNVLFLLPFLGGDPRARDLFGVALLLASVSSGWWLWSLYKDERYDVWRLLLVGSLWLAATLAGIHYFGVFSAVVAVLPLGVFFFGVTRDPRAQTVAYVVAAVSYFTLVMGSLHGHPGDRGLVFAAPATPPQSMVLVAIVEIVLVVTFVTARAARATTVLALARHERAAWAVAQKDALLLELQHDLARALDVAGVGRFSDTVVGRYKLGAVIGRGAMGEVYEAVHQEAGLEAAVKVLHTHSLREPESVQRFLREAEMAAGLDTPHVVKILEIGGFEGELPYIAMERLHGDDLAEILRRDGPMTLRDVLRLLSEVGAGLSATRDAGVVHRDVKPRNLFRTRGDGPGGGVWKLLDFGVSKLASAEITHAGDRIIGTPEYMAPEQAAGQPVTHKADLFSLAAVVYRALTGSPAFAGDHLVEVLYRVAHTMPPRPSALTDLGPEVDLVMAIALAKAPSERFETAEQLRDALDSAAQGKISEDVALRATRLLDVLPWGTVGDAEDV